MGSFQEVFLIIVSLFANLKLMSALYSRNVFSLQVKKFKNCQEVKHIMIMIMAIIGIFLSYIFDQRFKITFRKSSAPPPPPAQNTPPPPP